MTSFRVLFWHHFSVSGHPARVDKLAKICHFRASPLPGCAKRYQAIRGHEMPRSGRYGPRQKSMAPWPWHRPLSDPMGRFDRGAERAVNPERPTDKVTQCTDERSLYLEVHPNGSKPWRYKYRYMGKLTPRTAKDPATSSISQRFAHQDRHGPAAGLQAHPPA